MNIVPSNGITQTSPISQQGNGMNLHKNRIYIEKNFTLSLFLFVAGSNVV